MHYNQKEILRTTIDSESYDKFTIKSKVIH